MSNPKPHWRPRLASVPLVVTFVNKLAATGYECQNRDTRKRGFLLSFRKANRRAKQKGREISRPFVFFNSPVAEAMAAVRSGMPAGRAVVHRTTTTIGPAVPARSTPTSHGNGRGVGRCRLIERSYRHGLRCRHRRKAEADREQGHCNNFHSHSFLLVRDENDLAQMGLDHFTNGDDGASAGGASDDDASGGDASGGGASGGDASAPARASSDRLRSARRPPAQRLR